MRIILGLFGYTYTSNWKRKLPRGYNSIICTIKLLQWYLIHFRTKAQATVVATTLKFSMGVCHFSCTIHKYFASKAKNCCFFGWIDLNGRVLVWFGFNFLSCFNELRLEERKVFSLPLWTTFLAALRNFLSEFCSQIKGEIKGHFSLHLILFSSFSVYSCFPLPLAKDCFFSKVID